MAQCPACKKPVVTGLNSFSGLMVLLLAVSLWMLSFARFDGPKFDEAAGSIRRALHAPALSGSSAPLSSCGQEPSLAEFNQEIVLVHLLDQLNVLLAKQLTSSEAEIVATDRGIVVRLASDFLFQPANLQIRKESLPVLQGLATLLAGVENAVFVSGYTDNAPPPAGLPFPSNWGYSAGMAASVVQFLSETSGMDPSRLQALGLGEFSPRQPNATDAGRAANRRIELFISRIRQAPVVEKVVQPPKPTQDGEPKAPSLEPAAVVP
ncbi:MAG: OmpA family protein [Magnetococcales bacterium]|nr:OmpA family protein [Magnetococcales bacterium]